MELFADNAKPAPGNARRFAAFISYSHADAEAAAKLQRKLERYRLPKRIAETRISRANVLGPIFRDREDLAAAVSLSAAIRDAIARAEALIEGADAVRLERLVQAAVGGTIIATASVAMALKAAEPDLEIEPLGELPDPSGALNIYALGISV